MLSTRLICPTAEEWLLVLAEMVLQYGGEIIAGGSGWWSSDGS